VFVWDNDMTEEEVKIAFIRYRDDDGEPTCAINFQTGIVCSFYRTQRMGCNETCIFSPDDGVRGLLTVLERRKNGNGSLIPGEWCPIWNEQPKQHTTGKV
jgi:hypothetical protein